MSNIAEAPREKLKEIFEKNGEALLQDPDRCEGLLKDHCGPHRREISALVGALEERIPLELRSSWQGAMTPEAMRARLVQRLQDHRGLAPEVADWAVDAWSYALGVGLGRRSDRLDSAVISGAIPIIPPGIPNVPPANPAAVMSPAGIPMPAQAIPTSAYVREFGVQPPVQPAVVVPVPAAGWSKQKKIGAAAGAAALAFIIYITTPPPNPNNKIICPAGQVLSTKGICESTPQKGKDPGPGKVTPAVNPAVIADAPAIAAGTAIPVSVAVALNSDELTVGQYINGTIKTDINSGGKTLVPAGTPVVLQVKSLDQAGKIMGAAKIDLALFQMTISGKKYILASAVTEVKGPSKTVNTAKKAGIFGGIGAAAGCGIGHITGHKCGTGAAVGGGAGAATGVAVSAHDKPKPAEIKAGAILQFKLSEPVNIG